MSKASLDTTSRAARDPGVHSRETIERFTHELNLVLGSGLAPEARLRRIVRKHARFGIANRSFPHRVLQREANFPARFARVRRDLEELVKSLNG
jgi:hypothetical protein